MSNATLVYWRLLRGIESLATRHVEKHNQYLVSKCFSKASGFGISSKLRNMCTVFSS